MPPQHCIGLDPQFNGMRPLLREMDDVRLDRRAGRDVGECRSRPEVERLPQQSRRRGRITRGKRGVALLGKPEERAQVEQVRVHSEHVAGAACGEHLFDCIVRHPRLELSSQLVDVCLCGGDGALRRLVPPQFVNDCVEHDSGVRAQE